ncbi:hypothetical protein [Crateriforma spongiae]|uniref:hypothetical protein n=1 Tax=Crateriforma spongiae TaxID=2724528 RepID=UPI001F425FFB|nr:hypothetical protein [Crateriforma spongiae]
MKRFAIAFLAFAFVSAVGSSALATSPTGWDRVIVPTGQYRQTVKAMPIEQRPGRPLHVYGNTIRYRHQAANGQMRGKPLRRILLGTDQLRGIGR